MIRYYKGVAILENDGPGYALRYTAIADNGDRLAADTLQGIKNLINDTLPRRELWHVKITRPNGQISYLTHRGRIAWSRATAKKHLRDWIYRHGTGHKVRAEIERDE